MKSKKIFVWVAVVAIILSLLGPLFMVINSDINNNTQTSTGTVTN